MLAINAASNALGTITDVAAATALAQAAVGAKVFVDAVHYAPHTLVDVQAIGCDFLSCSAYKFYGPHIGVLWGKRDLIESLDAPRLEPAPQESPERLETGTQNHEGIVGAAAAVDFLASLANGDSGSRRDALRAIVRRAALARSSARDAKLWDGLAVDRRRSRVRAEAVDAANADAVVHVARPLDRRRRGSRSRSAACSCRTATSTRRRSSSGWASCRVGSFASGAVATRPRKKWIG